MNSKRDKQSKKTTIKKVAIGGAIVTGSIVTGVVLNQELNKNKSNEKPGNDKSGNFGISVGYNASTTSGAISNAASTAYTKTLNEVLTDFNNPANFNQAQWFAILKKEQVETIDELTNDKFKKILVDDFHVSSTEIANVTFPDGSTLTSFDGTQPDRNQSKSFKMENVQVNGGIPLVINMPKTIAQKAFENTITVTPKTDFLAKPYDAVEIIKAANYDITGGTIASVEFADTNGAADALIKSTANPFVAFDVNINVNVSNSGNSGVIPVIVHITKWDAQSAATSAENALASFSLSGDTWTHYLHAPSTLGRSDLFQYSYSPDNGTTWATLSSVDSSLSSAQSTTGLKVMGHNASQVKVRVDKLTSGNPNNTTVQDAYFTFANGATSSSNAQSVPTTGLKTTLINKNDQAFKDFQKRLTDGNQITLSGSSDDIQISDWGTIPSGVKLLLKYSDGHYYDSSSIPTGMKLYTQNLWDNTNGTTGAWSTTNLSTLNYKISLSDPNTSAFYDSSKTSEDSSVNDITGTTTPDLNAASLTKKIATNALTTTSTNGANAATGNTKNIVLPTFTPENNTSIEYAIIGNNGQEVFTSDATSVISQIVAHPLWTNPSTFNFKSIVARLKANPGFTLDQDQHVEIWSNASTTVQKFVDLSSYDFSSQIQTQGNSNSFAITSTILPASILSSNDYDVQWKWDGSSWGTKQGLDTYLSSHNLYDTTTGNWTANNIEFQVVPKTGSNVTFGTTNPTGVVFNQSNPGITAVIENTARTGSVGGNTSNITWPTITEQAHTTITYAIYSSNNTIVAGHDKDSYDNLKTFLAGKNLWNTTNKSWDYTKIVGTVSANSGYSLKETGVATTQFTIFDSANLPTNFNKVIDTTRVTIDGANNGINGTASITGTDSDALTLTENSKIDYGFHLEYSTDDWTTTKTKDEITAILASNLWDTTTKNWTIPSIKARLVAETGFALSAGKETTLWNSATTTNPTNKVVATTAFGTLQVSGTTTNVTFPTISTVPNGAVVEFQVIGKDGKTVAKAGDATTVYGWINKNNLWNNATQSWDYYAIKVHYVVDPTKSSEHFKVKNDQMTNVWDSSQTTLTKVVDVTAANTTEKITHSGNSKNLEFSEPTIPANAGYSYVYDIFDNQSTPQKINTSGSLTKDDVKTWIAQNNLWDISAGQNGAWRVSQIKVHLKAETNFEMLDEHETVVWDSATTTSTQKFVEVDGSFTTTDLASIVVDNSGGLSPDDKHLTWKLGTSSTSATKYNITITYALLDTPAAATDAIKDPSKVTWNSTLATAWPSDNIANTSKRVLVKITPKDSTFVIDPAKAIVDITSSTNISSIARHYVITALDKSAITLATNPKPTTKDLTITEPLNRNEFECVYSINNWQTTLKNSEINPALLALSSNEGMWNSETQSWRITSIQAKFVAKSGYVLDTAGATAFNLWTSSEPDKWQGTNAINPKISKWIDNTNTITDLQAAVKVDSTSFDTAVTWKQALANIKTTTDKGIKVDYLLSTTALADKGKTTTTGWTNNIETITTFNEDPTHRWLYVRISPSDSNDQLSSSMDDKLYGDLSTTSNIKTVATNIDTSGFTIDQDLLQGDTHHLTGSTTFSLANSTLTAYQKQGIVIHYTLLDWQPIAPSSELHKIFGSKIKQEMTETELKALFDGSATAGNLWKLSGSFAWTIKARFEATSNLYHVSSPKEVAFDQNAAVTSGKLKKWIDTTALFNGLTTDVNNKVSFNSSNSYNNSVTWVVPTLANLSYTDPISKLEYLVGNYPDVATANGVVATEWKDAPQTDISYVHADRHLWVKFVPKDATYVFSDATTHDLTTTSQIQTIKSKVDSLSDYTNWSAANIAFGQTTHDATISNSQTTPDGSKVEYQVQFYDTTAKAWVASSWKSESDFITFIGQNKVQIRTIQAHLAVTNATKYKIDNDKAANVNIAHFYSYVDISNELDKTKNWNDKVIQVIGTLGVTDGIQVVIPDDLTSTKLAPKGVVLQMSINGADFKNFIAATSSIQVDASKPFIAANAGHYLLLTAQDHGKNDPNTSLRFRIIANRNDYNDLTTKTDENDWKIIQDEVKVMTSDVHGQPTATAAPSILSWNLSSLPTLVQTKADWIKPNGTTKITLGGTTRALTIAGYTDADITSDVHSANSALKQDQLDLIKLGYHVDDKSLPANIFFINQDDFKTWLSGGATKAMKVYDSNAKQMVELSSLDTTKPDKYVKPLWNTIDMASFTVKWISIDNHYTVSDPATVTLDTHNKVAKWTDLTSYLNDLKNLQISGQTNRLVGAIGTIKQNLEQDFATDAFKIETTAKLDATNNKPDWTTPTENALPAEINFNFYLAFKIVPIDTQNFVASTELHNADQNPEIIWDIAKANNLLKAIHINVDDLEHVTLTGDTRNWSWTLADQYKKVDKDGQMATNGTFDGLETYAKLDGISGFDTYVPIDTLKTNLANPANINKFDGTWGRDKFRVQYKAKNGYVLDIAQGATNEKSPNTEAVNRFIDISNLITDATTNIIVEPTTTNKNKGWWNDASSSYDLKTDNQNHTWGGYVDNTDFTLHASITNTNLKVKIQYSTKATPTTNSADWSDMIPATLAEDITTRHLWIRYVADGSYTTTPTNEVASLSDSAAHEITAISKVRNVPTKIAVTGVDLSKVKISGDTRNITEDFTAAKVPANTHLEYSITNFMSVKSTDNTQQQNAIKALSAIGIDATNNAAIFNAYKASMTIAEFKTFISTLANANINILRNSISVRLVTEPGYSINETDDVATRKSVDVTNLYTFKDVTNELDPAQNWNISKIQALGVLNQTDGIQVIIPDALTEANLAPKGVVLQISINNGNYENFIAASSPIPADQDKGFIAANAGHYKIITAKDFGKGDDRTSLKFRIIANKNDKGVVTTVTDQNDWSAIKDDVMAITSDLSVGANPPVTAPSVLNWDLSALPTLVQTKAIDWIKPNGTTKITLGGTTRALTIAGYTDADITSNLKAANAQLQDSQLALIKLGYHVDDKSLPANIFFTQDDFKTWLSGGAQATMKVYDSGANKMVELGSLDATKPDKYVKPSWNTIDISSFVVRWIAANDNVANGNATGFTYKVSDSASIPLDTHDKVAKWTDLTSYLDDLKNLQISGQTDRLTSTLATIKQRLDNEFKTGTTGAFKIQTTAKVDAKNKPNWTGATDNALPSEINFDYDLAFKIVPLDDKNFVASTETHNTTTNPEIIWDTIKANNLLKAIHVNLDDLERVILDGNTRTWTSSLAPQYLKADKDGQMSATGTYDGLEIYAKLDGVNGFNAYVAIDTLKANLAAANISTFDGSWGRDKFRVQYKTKLGFAFATNSNVTATTNEKNPNTDAVDRFIDVTALITDATTHTIVEPKDTTKGWWNDASSSYDLKTDNQNHTWGGYVDNTDFTLHAIGVDAKLKVKIQYSTKASPASNGDWSDTIPTTLDSVTTNRHLWIRYVADGSYTTTPKSDATDEIAILSDSAQHDVMTVSKVRNVPTKIAVTGVDLSKVKISGDTRNITEDFTAAKVPVNTHLEYSITNFMSVKSTDNTQQQNAIKALSAIGIDATNNAAIFNAYKASMTIAEFKTFISTLANANINILRNSISVRLVTEPGYSINETDDVATRKSVDVTNLYTFKDITSLASLMKLASSNGATDGINLYGTKATDDGISVSIPDELVTAKLSALGFTLQYTTKGIAGGPNNTTIDQNANWADVNLTALPAEPTSGIPAINNGFKLRLDSINTVNNVAYSFIAFRLVPNQDDQKVAITGTNPTDKLDAYYIKTHTKLFTVNGTTYTPQSEFYSIDTSKIPTVIHVEGIDLATILAKGTTKDLIISGDDAAHGQVDGKNTDKVLDDQLEFLYAIDKTSGAFIDGDKNSADALWLTKSDMIAYLAGNLVVKNNTVVYKAAQTVGTVTTPAGEVVEAFTPAIIAARKLSDGKAVLPDYLAINTIDSTANANSFFVKWVAMDKDYNANAAYIPSVIEPSALGYTAQDFKKWFDGARFNDAIAQVIVTGDTHDYKLDFKTNQVEFLQDTELGKYGLKMQYSFDNKTWQDQMLDFSTKDWATKDARKIYMRVVPQAYTSPGQTGDSATADGIFIDYSRDHNGGKEIIDTKADANGVKAFKTYLDVGATLVQGVVIKGNSFMLAGDADHAITESMDTGHDEFSQLEIQYLYKGNWYNKTGLVAFMIAEKAKIHNAVDAAAWVAPTDFNHTTVKARWHVLDDKNYVIKDQKPNTNVTPEQEVTSKAQLKTFVNVWSKQEYNKENFNGVLDPANPGQSNLDLQNKLLTISTKIVKDSTDPSKISYKFNLDLLDKLIQEDFFNSNGLKVQWSVNKNASDEIANTADWKDWDKKDATGTGSDWKNIIFEGDLGVDPHSNPTIYLRIVPVNSDTTVVSTTANDGNGTTVKKIVIDTSAITYQIETEASALENLVISGDTQNQFGAAEDPFVKAHDEGNNAFGVTGITEYITDASSQQITHPTEQQANDWLTSLGVQINYKVKATRTKGTYVAGQEYTFDNKVSFKAALDTHNLNFDKSTLQVRWNFTNPKYSPSDAKWVTPSASAMTNLVNSVYTEDIYTLGADSLVVSGNSLKIQKPTPSTTEVDKGGTTHTAATTLTDANLLKLGIKIQYNWTADSNDKPVDTAWYDNAPDGSSNAPQGTGTAKDQVLDGQKHYWIRFTTIDANTYKLVSDIYPNKLGEQVTAINVAKVKLAVPFKGTVAEIQATINNLQIEGKTYNFTYVSGHALPTVDIPKYPIDDKYSIQYSHDGTKWSDSVKDMLSDTDYYGNGIHQLDKDRGDKFYIRYVYGTNNGNVAPTNSNDYVFTDSTGNEIQLSDLTKTIDINGLEQPVFTSATIGQLTGQTSVTVANATTPKNTTDFASVTWKEMADFGLFKPNFVAGNTDTTADFKYMWYDGNLGIGPVDTSGNFANYIFNLAQNPFNSVDKETKTNLNALVPRHTHLEYRWSGGSSANWSSWNSTPPTGIEKNSNWKGFQVRLVADAGYILNAGTNQNGASEDFDIQGKYLDKSDIIKTSLPAQDWGQSYNVVVELRTKDVTLPANGADQATFVGWNDAAKSTGTLATTDPNNDHTPSNDASHLKNIIFKLLQPVNGVMTPMDFTADDKGYVVEWNVQDGNGHDISWTDSRDTTFVGWHSASADTAHPEESLTAPGSSVPWYGAYPKSLKNGDVVQVRLRARNGFIISNDDKATDYDASSKTSKFSHVMTLDPVASLTNRIDIPNNFAFYDSEPKHLEDFQSQPIPLDASMPRIAFIGNEGQGTISITGGPNGVHYHYEVAVLRPVNQSSSTNDKMNAVQRPFVGYCLETEAQQVGNNKLTMIWDPTNGWTKNYKDTLNAHNAWVDPSTIKDLSVGDAVIVRLVADAGYGFEWEDKTTQFIDHYFPKNTSFNLFGTVASPQSIQDDKLGGVAANQIVITDVTNPVDANGYLAPIPARGLFVKPRYDLSQLRLVYNTNPALNLNNGKSQIYLNLYPGVVLPDSTTGVPTAQGLGDKYKWIYTVNHNGVTSNSQDYINGKTITGLVNGDVLTFTAAPKNASYAIDNSYNNSGVSLMVQGLADPLNADGISRPVIHIGGYDGAGTIDKIVPSGTGPAQQWETYQPGSPELAQYPLGRPLESSETAASDLIWQYQVLHYNPANSSDSQLASESWSNTIPHNLKFGDYVRMRVGTVDPTKVALADGGTKWVYSQNPTPILDKDGKTGQSSQTDSWFVVDNLFIDTTKLEHEVGITGFIRKTNISLESTINSDEDGFVIKQLKVIYGNPANHNNETESKWLELAKGTEAAMILNGLENNDKIVWRDVAREHYSFNPNDADVKSEEYTPWIRDTNTDALANKGWIEDSANKQIVNVFQKGTWTFTVSGLKIYLNTDGVKFNPDPSDIGGIDINKIISNTDGVTLEDLLKQNPKGEIIDGKAIMKPIVIDPATASTIVDVDGKATNSSGVDYSTLVGVRYIVKTVDPFTGQQNPEYIVDGKSGDVPKGLSNGDQVTIELYPVSDDYKLSQTKTFPIKISGLTVSIESPISDPFLTFAGDSGKGSVSINPQAPIKTKWVYAVQPEALPGQPALIDPKEKTSDAQDFAIHPVDPDDKWVVAHPNQFYYVSAVPTDLKNGDRMIALLFPSIPGAGTNIQIPNTSRPGERPMSPKWVTVSGLAQKIDLSRYNFNLVDTNNLWTPNLDNGYDATPGGDETYKVSNYAFKLNGHQNGQASFETNAILSTLDPSSYFKLLVDQNLKPLPHSIADNIQWAFSVNNNPDPNGDYSWTTTMPQGLSNGEYVHVKLVGKSGLKNIEVFGYKPQVYKVAGLNVEASVTSKVATLVGALVGGVAALGASVGGLLLIRRRKKKLHWSE